MYEYVCTGLNCDFPFTGIPIMCVCAYVRACVRCACILVLPISHYVLAEENGIELIKSRHNRKKFLDHDVDFRFTVIKYSLLIF